MPRVLTRQKKRGLYVPQGRQLIPVKQLGLLGLDQTTPYDLMSPQHSPYFTDGRVFAHDDADRRVSIATRKGPGFYSVPIGETQDQAVTSTTGAADQTFGTVKWLAQKFTAGASTKLTRVDLNLKTDTGTGHIIVEIRNDSSGSPGTTQLAQSSILSTDLGSSYAYETARFIEAPTLTSATDYWILVYIQDSGGGSGLYNISSTTSATTAKTSGNSGGSWTAASYALNFKTFMSTAGKVKGLTRYYPTSGTNLTLFAHSQNVYKVSNESTGATTSIVGSLSSSATDYYFDFADDDAYWVNGVDVPKTFDGTTVSSVSGSPGVSKYLAVHKNRVFFVPTSDPTRINFSDLGDYATYGGTSFIYVPTPKSTDPITGLLSFQDVLIIYTRKTKYLLYGSDLSNFVLRQAFGGKGAIRQDAISKDENHAYALADDGVYRFNGSEDELVSRRVEPEINNMADKAKASLQCWKGQVRIYYPQSGSSANDRMLLLDTTLASEGSPFGEWMLDTDVYVDKTYVYTQDDNDLAEASSLAGFVMYAEQDYNNLGRAINFDYRSNYFSFEEPAAKKRVKRVYPILRSQSGPFRIEFKVSKDFKDATRDYNINTQAVGSTWGGGETWGGGAIYGKSEIVDPRLTLSGNAKYWQFRFVKAGVNAPVELLGYVVYYRLKRPK